MGLWFLSPQLEGRAMKVWRTAGDGKVCEACQALDGKAAGDGWDPEHGSEVGRYVKTVDGQWKRTGPAGVVGEPPLHPNGRCTIEEVPDEGE
jgi:hypothetical protein